MILNKWNLVITGIVTLLVFGLIAQPSSARVISFQEQYQDYTGAFHPYTSENLIKYPLYIIIDNGNTYTVSRMDDSIEFTKSNSQYYFDTNKISFTLNFTPAVLASRSTQDGANWYINIPKPLTSKRFTWDFKKPVVTNNTGYVIPGSNFWFTNVNNQPRLYYNQAARNVGALSTYIKFEFNSFIVSNVTTSGWTTANITLNGSRFTDDGNLSIHLRNDSALNMTNLTAYWSADETQNTIWHNVNNESGLPNSTNQGTWNGNTTLNYTTGVIGNAGLLDGVNDFVNFGNDASLNVNNYSIAFWMKYNGVGTAGKLYWTIITKEDTGVSFLEPYHVRIDAVSHTIIGSAGDGVGAEVDVDSLVDVSDGRWYHVVLTKNLTYLSIYINATKKSAAVTFSTPVSASNLLIGKWQGYGNYFNGAIDEVQIWDRDLNATEVSVLYNTSMRTNGNVTIWQQNATSGYKIDSVRLIVYNTQQNNNTVDIYTKPNSSMVWNLTAVNISSNTWYNIDSGNQSTSQDFLVAMSGNGSDTPFFTSLEWDEVVIPVPVPFIASTGQPLSWWVLLIVLFGVIGLAINYKPDKINIGAIIALVVLVIAIGIIASRI